MTVVEFLQTLTYSDDVPVKFAKARMSRRQLGDTADRPYVVLSMGPNNPLKRTHHAWLWRHRITLNIYQEPREDDSLPSSAEAEQLWNALFTMPEHVNEGFYGRDLNWIEWQGGMGIDYAERSSGLVGNVMFALIYSAQAASGLPAS